MNMKLIKGLWFMKGHISGSFIDADDEVRFLCNGDRYKGFYYDGNGDLYYYYSSDGEPQGYYIGGTWDGDTIGRLLDFGDEPQEVRDSVYTWIRHNAVYLPNADRETMRATISGKWFFNEELVDYGDNCVDLSGRLNFDSDGFTYSGLMFDDGRLEYDGASGYSDDVVYLNNTWMSMEGRWIDLGTAPQDLHAAEYGWFLLNATRYEYLEYGEYLFHEHITDPTGEGLDLAGLMRFYVGNVRCDGLVFIDGRMIFYSNAFPDGYKTVYENGQWIDENDRMIYLEEAPEWPEYIMALHTMMVCVNELMGYISGTWRLRESLYPYETDMLGCVTFTCDGVACDGFFVGFDMTMYIQSVTLTEASMKVYDNGWADERYRTFDFGNVPQNIAKSALYWIMHNADPVPKKGVLYQDGEPVYPRTSADMVDGLSGAVLPAVTAEDDGKVLQVKEGQWRAGEAPAAGGGDVPHIGANGNWYVGTTDTGVPASGVPGPQGPSGLLPTHDLLYNATIHTLLANHMNRVTPTTIAQYILGDGMDGYDNEWGLTVTFGDMPHSLILPTTRWPLGIAPTFAANTTTVCRFYYVGDTLCGEWVVV